MFNATPVDKTPFSEISWKLNLRCGGHQPQPLIGHCFRSAVIYLDPRQLVRAGGVVNNDKVHGLTLSLNLLKPTSAASGSQKMPPWP